MKENKNTLYLLFGSNIINTICEDISDNKTNREVNELLVEELSKLIKAVIKLERWDNGETTLRYNIDEINNSINEELSDVIIMMIQFIYKNNISYHNLLKIVCKKLIRYYETKQEQEEYIKYIKG